MTNRAVIIKIRVDKGDGGFTESETAMPLWIADHLLCEAIDWRNRYLMTANELEHFEETQTKLKSK